MNEPVVAVPVVSMVTVALFAPPLHTAVLLGVSVITGNAYTLNFVLTAVASQPLSLENEYEMVCSAAL